MVSVCISAISSNQGKTILSSALLYHFRDSVRPFKIGPDFIDPQFHQKICGTPSINLDAFMMTNKQIKWLYDNYSDKKVNILEGVMGFYDGMDKKSSAYDISKLLQIPVIMVLDGSGSYITVSAVLQGLKTYKKDNTIKAVVLNRISSQSHYELIASQIKKDFKDIEVLGWIPNHLESLKETHLGLDLSDMDKLEDISKEVLQHIDLSIFNNSQFLIFNSQLNSYPFKTIKKTNKKIAVVNDDNFSFLYYDNLKFLQEVFADVVIIDATKDESIPDDCDVVYIPGGYVETPQAYAKIQNSQNFKNSLINHAKTKKIYAECAGLLYLGNCVDDKQMSGILDVDFTLEKRFQRLGYYYNEEGIKGHAFHYTKPCDDTKRCEVLSKELGGDGVRGSWKSENSLVFGTYLHTMLRANTKLIKKRFL
ncbi:cobyrinate a,c-diamide synthase [Arcobacter sp. FWKO B]|uniref:cobyrinate a,c-diamide synthase n=1 Tax=Arcobacter sp. FWKO B TaxID=2593672 RepID=UPI0018A65134|nr:cobyrinate a,c-diamide synthase [Arcobacter sp. FWKO B]QOG12469.1 cobyrinate a,c-diamide synthase [Arcobacter sp. FWKO B]